MKLEIKHLAPYLPNQPFIYFGVLAGYEMIYPVLGYQPHKILTYEDGNRGNRIWMDLEQFQYHRLVLHPLSSLTKPITHKGETFVPTEWFEIGDDQGEAVDYGKYNIKVISSLEAIAKHNIHHDIQYLPYGVVQKLHEWHIDTENLIGGNLAIDANTLTENPYAK